MYLLRTAIIIFHAECANKQNKLFYSSFLPPHVTSLVTLVGILRQETSSEDPAYTMQTSDSQSVPGPEASASPDKLLEVQFSSPSPESIKSKTLKMEPSSLSYNKHSKGFSKPKFRNHCFRTCL